MRNLSLTFLARVVLVVLLFEAGRSSDVRLEALEISHSNDQTNKTAECSHTLTINGNTIYHAQQQAFYNYAVPNTVPNTDPNTVVTGRKGCCVSTLKRNDYVIRPGVGAHKLFHNQVTWNTAREICMREGGQLPVIDSNEKAAVFRSWITNESLTGVWIGIHDLFEQGKWVTLTGEPLAAISYSPWAAGEPNNKLDVEHCAALWKDHANGIFDVPCTAKYSFICEINPL